MTDNNITLQHVVLFLGQADKETLNIVQTTISTRRSILQQVEAATNLSNIDVGDHVVLHGLSPKYLNGVKGRITEVRDDGYFSVAFDEPIQTKRGVKRSSGIPYSCVTKIEV